MPQVAVTGTGVAMPVLSISPAVKDFGSIGVGLHSGSTAFTIANTGTDDASGGTVTVGASGVGGQAPEATRAPRP